MDSDEARLALIVACSIVAAAVRTAGAPVSAAAFLAFAAADLALHGRALGDLSLREHAASAAFVIVLPAAAAFATARVRLLARRPIAAAALAGIAYAFALLLGLVIAVNAGLVVP